MRSRIVALPITLLLGLGSLLGGCCGGDDAPEPSRWDTKSPPAITEPAVPATAPGAPGASAVEPSATAAPEPAALAGGAFNAFFPADGTDGYSRVFSQEKTGFAEAKLSRDGNEVAVLSISDTASNPAARAKFASATDRIDGHPYVAVGKSQSSILVRDRFQVKVSSSTLPEEERKSWLQKFNLAGLQGL